MEKVEGGDCGGEGLGVEDVDVFEGGVYRVVDGVGGSVRAAIGKGEGFNLLGEAWDGEGIVCADDYNAGLATSEVPWKDC